MTRPARGLGALVLVGLAALSAPAQAQPQYTVTGGVEESTAAERDGGWFADRRGFAAKLRVGPAYRQLFFSSILAVDADVSLGAQTGLGGFYGTLGALYGSTIEGLWTLQIPVGATWEAPVMEGLHVGGGPNASFLAIKRATTGNLMTDMGVGLHAFGSYDVFADDDAAIFVELDLAGDYHLAGDAWPPALLYGATLGLGVRLY
ncbi:MAG: hypothetical protein JRI55_24125 [Deltaproteobacteria bacterium]|jgi:hypothetical protein|nr:hypothetical protein [Deltaproteobacteria bacterium]